MVKCVIESAKGLASLIKSHKWATAGITALVAGGTVAAVPKSRRWVSGKIKATTKPISEGKAAAKVKPAAKAVKAAAAKAKQITKPADKK
jgi:hypothetical protein